MKSERKIITSAPLPLLLLCLTGLFLLPQALSQSANHPNFEKLGDLIETRLLSRIQRSGTTRVIVGLETETEAALLARPQTGRPAPQAEITRRAAINRLQERLLQRLPVRGARVIRRFGLVPYLTLEIDTAALETLNSLTEVESIREDRLFKPTLAVSIPLIGADLTNSEGFTGAGQAIAILDSGVDKNHSFLSSAVIPEAEACFSTTSVANNSTTLCPNDTDSQTGDGAGINCSGISGCDHGTHVAGITAGDGDSFTGVAKGAELIPIQVFSRFDNNPDVCGSSNPCIAAYTSDIVLGLEHAYSLADSYNIASVNMSLGGDTFTSSFACDSDSPALKAAIDDLRSIGIPTVIASGNESKGNAIASPGCISSAVSVGATTDADLVADFSNSASWLSLLAPGYGISSSVPGSGYASKSGTSMATPHVAGSFATLRSAIPQGLNLSVDQLLAALTNSGVPIIDGRNGFSTPRIQVDAAADALRAGDPSPLDLILDSDYAGALIGGSSFSSFADDAAYAGRALVGDGAGEDLFRFTPELPQTGYYRVSAWWPVFTTNSDQALFDVTHDGGTTSLLVDQQRDGSQWNELGIFPFLAGSSGHVELSDRNGPEVIVDAVRFESLPPLTIDTQTLPDAVLGSGYENTLDSSDGVPPYSWSITAGRLPDDLSLDPTTGNISGIPSVGGSFPVTIQLQDTDGRIATRDFELSVTPFLSTDFGHPYIQNPTADGITFIWWSWGDTPATLAYGVGGYTDTLASIPVAVTLTRPEQGDEVTRYRHEVTLTDLLPGATYQYRVGTFESAFRTVPSDPLAPLRFVVWADPETEPGSHGTLGSGAPTDYPMDQNEGIMATVLATSNLDPDLILIAGDLVQEGGRLQDWDELFRKVNDRNPEFYSTVAPLASRIPIQAVPGNHDYYGVSFGQPNSEIHAMHKFIAHLANPDNTATTDYIDPEWPSELNPALRQTQNERYFAFRQGPATFIGIDTNNQSPDDSDYDTNWYIWGENGADDGPAPDWMPGSRQYQWLEEQLQKAERETPFTFVQFHQPPYSSGPHAQPPGVDKQSGLPTRHLNALFHKYRVTAVFNGHDEAAEMSDTRGEPEQGGDPEHLLRYFVLPSAGDGLRSKLSDLLNPKRVFHASDSAEGRHYGLLLGDITLEADDAWKARFRLAWIDPDWAADNSIDPIGGFYGDTDPAASFEAVRPVQLPIIEESATAGVVISGSFSPVTSPDSYGGSALRAGDTGEQRFRFIPAIPTTGLYHLHAFWPASTVNAPNAIFTIETTQGTVTRQANQRVGGGQWNPLGIFEMVPGDSIELSGPNAVADAIRLEQLPIDKPHITDVTLPKAAMGGSYSAPLNALGGTAPYTWSLIDGSLPQGISLAADGTLAGTPEGPAIARFTIQAQDAAANIGRRQLTLIIDGAGTLLLERFDDGDFDDRWDIVDEGTEQGPSNWTAANGILIQSSDIYAPETPDKLGTYALYDPTTGGDWVHYRVSATVRSMDDDHLGLMARYQDADNYYRLSWSREEMALRLTKRVGGVTTILAETGFIYDQGRSYQVEFTLLGYSLEVKIDGQTLLTASDTDLPQGSVALYNWRNSGGYFDDILVTDLSGANLPPIISSISASPETILDTQSTQLNVTAIDPDAGPNPNLSYSWSVLPDAGTLSDPMIANPVFTPPDLSATQVYTLTVEVSDGEAVTSAGVNITVQDADAPPGLFSDNFDDGNYQGWTIVDEGWAYGPSAWSAASTALIQSSNITDRTGGDPNDLPKLGTYALYDNGTHWVDYQTKVILRSEDDDAIGLMFRVQDAENFYRFSWDKQRSYRRLVKKVGGLFTLLAEESVPYVQGQSYQLEVSAQGPLLQISIDGVPIFSFTDTDLASGSIALYNWANDGSYYDDVQVTALSSDFNLPPVISSISATPNTLLDTEDTQLQVTVTDPDGDDTALTYQWGITPDEGSLDNPNSLTPIYTPIDISSTKTYTLTVEISDGEAATSASVNVTVQDADAPPALLEESFDDGNYQGWTIVDEGWAYGPSAWSAVSTALIQSSNITDRTGSDPNDLPKLGTYALYDNGTHWVDYQTKVILRSEDDDAIGLMFRVQDAENFYRFSWDKQRSYRRLVKKVGGLFTLLAEESVPYVQGQSYQLEVTAQGPLLQVYIDGAPVFSVTDADLASGSIALYNWANDGSYYDDIQATALGSDFNLPPVISSISATPNTVLDNEDTQLQVTATDPDGDDTALTYQWSISPDEGSLDNPNSPTPIYTPVDINGTKNYTFTVEISDGESTTTGDLDVTVQDADAPPALLEDNFDDGNYQGWSIVDEGWAYGPSAWSAASTALIQSSNITDRTGGDPNDLPKLGTYALYDNGTHWVDYQTKVILRSEDDDAIGLMFRVQDAENFYRFSWDKQRSYRRLVKKVGGLFTLLAEESVPYVQGQRYQLEVTAQGPLLQVHVDGAPVFSVTDADLASGSIALYNWANDGSDYDDIQVTALGSDFNLPPVISSISATPNTILDNEDTQLQVTATDPDGDDTALTYQWSISPDEGSLDNPNSPTPIYTPVDINGTKNYTFTIEISDGEAATSASVNVTVQDADAPPALLEESFDDGNYQGWTIVDEGWAYGPSAWSAASTALIQSSNITDRTGSDPNDLPKLGTYALYDNGTHWVDYQANVTLRSDDDDAIGLMFRVQDADNYYRFSWDKQRSYRRLVKKVGGLFTLLAEESVPYVQGQSYQLEVTAQGPLLQVHIDGAPVFSVTDADLASGSIALYNWANKGSYYDDVAIYNSTK